MASAKEVFTFFTEKKLYLQIPWRDITFPWIREKPLDDA
jgi:hypothetical protein